MCFEKLIWAFVFPFTEPVTFDISKCVNFALAVLLARVEVDADGVLKGGKEGIDFVASHLVLVLIYLALLSQIWAPEKARGRCQILNSEISEFETCPASKPT